MMKIIATILFAGCLKPMDYLKANSIIYYVSNAGSDAANGTSTSTSWLSIAKVNSSSFNPGDQILFKGGDSWNEQLNVSSSGSAGNVITIGSYGTGKATFTGFQTLSMNSLGSNLYSATATNSVKNQNTVLVNGTISAKGRTPNATYLLTNAPSNTTVINTALTGTPNYTGGELVLNDMSYIWDVARIASQSSGTLNLVIPVTYASDGNNKYFIQNLPSLCDVQNEWAYDSTTRLLTVYSTSSPTVQISTIDTLVHILKKNYITFDGLNITGANNVGICKDTANYITVKNCTFNYIGGFNPLPISMSGLGGAAIRGENADYSVTKNDSILNSLNNAIFDVHTSDYDSIYGNYIRNTGMLVGMGAGSNGSSMAIFTIGHKPYIYNNQIINTGYTAISFLACDTSLVKNNYIDTFCVNKSDGGGIYTAFTGSEGSIIIDNIVRHGSSSAGNSSPGIYLDNEARYITVTGNTVEDGYFQTVLFHYPDHIEFHDNTIVGNTGACFWYAVGGAGYAFNITRNIFYQKDTVSANSNATFYDYYSTLFSGSVSDSNYFLRPLKEVGQFRFGATNTSYDLAGWRTLTGYELHSSPTPDGITSAPGTLYINPTLSNSIINFIGLYIDAKGANYNNSAVLLPFKSLVLFKADHEVTRANTVLLQTFKLIQQ